MTRISAARILLTTALAFALSGTVRSEDWPQFLGPQRNGISKETGLLKAWPADGLKVLWRAKGGVGMAGVVVQGKQALTVAQDRDDQMLICLNVETGKALWRTTLAPAFGNQMGDGPRGTPTLDKESAYVFTGDGQLIAVGLAEGKIRWRHNVLKDHGGKPADYGMACSPLLVDDKVIVTAGAPNATLVAYNRQTGEKVWATGKDPAGYSSPTLLEINGKPQIVAFTGASCIGVRPNTGEQLWRYPFTTDYQCNIATPLSIDGNVFISSGEAHGSALLSLTTKAGRTEVAEVWTSLGPRATMKNEWQTSILLDGKLYGLDNVGSAGPVTHLACIDAATGKPVWQQPRFGKSNLIAADGKLIFTTMKGEVVLAKASPAGYHEIGRSKLLKTTRQAPSLAHGRLYVRDDEEIVCVDLRSRD